MKCTQRLYLTADKKKLVPEGDRKAASLYAVPGDEIPQSAADLFGLIDGHLKGFDPAAETKEKAPARDKEQKGGEDKGGSSPPPPPPATDDLTKIKGIGPGVAKALAAVNITTFAQLGAVDPAAAPAIDKLPPRFDWVAVAKAAREQVAAAGTGA